ncbi:MAG TPA: choice-of-anchor D domain-containing protein, partial [Candidatus Binatia bacterium]|nr:choice-of-anchor D domain-containing protein [Candidatus Binatia bacterium]
KFDPAAATLAYSTFLGPNNAASPFSLVLDSNNDAFVLAGTSSSTFTTNSAIEPYSSGSDLLLVEVDPVASTQLMSTYIGGSGDEQPAGIALDAAGNIYVAGSTSSTDLPVTGAAFQTISGGGTDAFIAKIGPTSAPSVSLTPLSLQFGTVSLGGSSAAQTVLLRNMGSSALSLSISPTGDFGQTNDCSSSVPAAGSCSLSVTFTPTAAGNRSGSILLEDNAAGSPQQISLSGVGLGPGVLFSPTALTFASVPLGTSAAAQTVTLTNNGNAALQIASVQAGGDFSQTNNCPSTLAVAANCSINVAFTPTASGTRTGTLTVNDNLPGNSQTVSLSGTGADFSVTASPSQNTVNQGSSATYTIHISSVGGAFNNPVSLSCSGLPTSATCSFSPASPTPSANGVSSTLTIGTGSSGSENVLPFSSPTRPVMAMWLQFQTLGLVGMVVLGSRKKSRKSAVLVLLVVLVFGLLLLTGCAGGTGIGPQNNSGGSGTTYNVTVTGVSGTLQHSVVVSLTVK